MTTRRDFIKKTVAGTAALSLGSIIPGFGSNSYQEILGANEKIRIGDCWKVSLQNPYTQQTLDEFCLTDNTLSTSGNTEQYTGHIINPLTGIYNEQKKVTSILSDNPLDAEILSTVWMIAVNLYL